MHEYNSKPYQVQIILKHLVEPIIIMFDSYHLQYNLLIIEKQ